MNTINLLIYTYFFIVIKGNDFCSQDKIKTIVIRLFLLISVIFERFRPLYRKKELFLSINLNKIQNNNIFIYAKR
ncbi:hypothetical protein HMPREF0647_02595 [Prevotella bivia DNF00320]|uniref:Uncharacterized protein n=1 Tax=Prevotella bivia DNF00320 TaxID=1401068 RepID=A0A096CJD3_9BACT|nr:hypothetical protein HMPREF1651_05765 [Prevotella bivia DNF00188]KGF34848.1 hypothetical protein HMPREF2136_10115 [Prevotella bivia DNF00650]KGF45429.1 hypothetical protein HMPREF0647_02595 [Prevotella bivia DNF00320]